MCPTFWLCAGHAVQRRIQKHPILRPCAARPCRGTHNGTEYPYRYAVRVHYSSGVRFHATNRFPAVAGDEHSRKRDILGQLGLGLVGVIQHGKALGSLGCRSVGLPALLRPKSCASFGAVWVTAVSEASRCGRRRKLEYADGLEAGACTGLHRAAGWPPAAIERYPGQSTATLVDKAAGCFYGKWASSFDELLVVSAEGLRRYTK